MTIQLYSQDTTPANAAQISADKNEIVHVECVDSGHRRTYANSLAALLANSHEFGGGNAELEVIGDLGGENVRVHLSLL